MTTRWRRSPSASGAITGSWPSIIWKTSRPYSMRRNLRIGAEPARLGAESRRPGAVPRRRGAVLLVAVGFVTVNFVIDLLYVYLDPRIRLGTQAA